MTAQERVNALARKQPGKLGTFWEYLRAPQTSDAIARLLPRGLSAEKALQIAQQVVKGNKALMDCTPASLIVGVLEASALGLYLDGALGHAYLVPYKHRGQTLAQMQIGYRGMIDLGMRSGHIESVGAGVIREGDAYEYDEAVAGSVRHRRSIDPGREQAPILVAWCQLLYTSGKYSFPTIVLPAEIERARAASRASRDDAPWKRHEEAMAQKTAIRRRFKWERLSPEILSGVVRDEYREEGIRVAIAPGVEALLPDILGDEAKTVQPDRWDDEPLPDVALPSGKPKTREPGEDG